MNSIKIIQSMNEKRKEYYNTLNSGNYPANLQNLCISAYERAIRDLTEILSREEEQSKTYCEGTVKGEQQ